MKKDTFEEWLRTKEGENILKCHIYYTAGEIFFKNVLWWAFQAGSQSLDTTPSQAGLLLHEIVKRGKKVPTDWMLTEAKRIIEQTQQHEK